MTNTEFKHVLYVDSILANKTKRIIYLYTTPYVCFLNAALLYLKCGLRTAVSSDVTENKYTMFTAACDPTQVFQLDKTSHNNVVTLAKS